MNSLRTAIAAALLSGSLVAPTVAAATDAVAGSMRPLDAALRDLARRTGLQIIYVADVTKGINIGTSDESGTPAQALTRLLDGTNLSFEFLNERTVEIGPRAPAVATVRPASFQPVEASGQTRGSGVPATVPETLEEMIVTARKRDERLLDVPIAVTAFDGDSLARRGVSAVSDFLQEAPGVSVYPSAGTFKIAIRGISTSLGSNENGYYLDDLPFTGVTVPINPDVRAWDLERVEVLRGPQGTLFGEGSLGGTVRILTRDPQFNEWQGQVVVSGSDTKSGGGGNEAYKGMLNVPILDDRLALRLGATKENIDGWITDSLTGEEGINSQDIETKRAKLRFQPTERLSIAASYWNYEGEFPRDNTADDDGFAGTGVTLASETNYDLYGASANYQFDGFTVSYTYAKNELELPQSGDLFGGQLIAGIEIDVESHELRASSTGDGPFQWTAGAYRREGDRRDAFLFALFGIDNTSATDTSSEALFGEATYTLPSLPLDLTVGLRSVREKLEGLEANAGVPEPGVSETYKSTNPRFVLAWRPNDAWRVYASAAKGYRSGQLQPSVSLS
ncbi:MAG: TonB-dependent receptor domain-containing protein, partial [Gammaproteobacteria bacterium]